MPKLRSLDLHFRIPRPEAGEDFARRPELAPERAGFVVDLRRCIGCHACSVACKTAHDVPLGVFPLRVRWLPRPQRETVAFLPVFSETLCGGDPESLEAGLEPACSRACPTDALIFGDWEEADSVLQDLTLAHAAEPLAGPEADDLKHEVRYIGLEPWMGEKLNRGAALDPRDEDPIYEQGP